jgi:membrane protein
VSVAQWIERARSFVSVDLWRPDPERQPHFWVFRLLQFGIMVVEGFVRDHLLLRAAGLAYFTVLSVVPLLAVAVSIASAVGVGSETFVDWVVGTLTAVVPETGDEIRGLIARADFAGLGSASAGILLITTILAIGNVETALNGIWGVTQSRSLSRRVSDYLTVLLVGPILGGVSLSFATTLQSQEVLQRTLSLPGISMLTELGLRQLPAVMLGVVMGFLYWFLPNTRVQFKSALLGAIPAGLMIVAAQGLFIDFSVGVARASAFFGSFAALPLLFAWIYAFWAIFLFGAEIAFAHQNLTHYRQEVRGEPAGPAERESIGLRLALEVGRRFRDEAPALDVGALADALHAPVRPVRDVADKLLAAGILAVRAREAGGVEGLQLGRPANKIQVLDVLAALRGDREPAKGDAAVAESVDAVLSEFEETITKAASGRSVADLLDALAPLPDADPSPPPQ